MNILKTSSRFSKTNSFIVHSSFFKHSHPLVGIVDTGLMGNLGETKYLAATSIASVMT